MTRDHHTPFHRIVRRLWPSPARFAAASALYDPTPLLALQRVRRARR